MTADQLTLAGIRREGVGETRDGLDRHFTPFPLARIVVDAVHEILGGGDGSPGTVVEPSVGGGAIARAARERWPTATLIGVDVDDQAEGFRLCDAFTCGDWTTCSWPDKADVVIGNPPFTGDTAIPHIRKALKVAHVVALILPWEAAGAGRDDDYWTAFLFGGPLTQRPIAIRQVVGPRPWGDSIRQAALYVWCTHLAVREERWGRRTEVEPLPRWKP